MLTDNEVKESVEPLNNSLVEKRNDGASVPCRGLLQDNNVVFQRGDGPSSRRLGHLPPVLRVAYQLSQHGLLEHIECFFLHELSREEVSKLRRERERKEDSDCHIGHLRDGQEQCETE